MIDQERKRVLFISAVHPKQKTGGGGVASQALVSLLEGLPMIKELEVLDLSARKRRLPHRFHQLTAIIQSAFSPLSSKSCFDSSTKDALRVAKAAELGDFDIIVINGGELFFLSAYLPVDKAFIGIEHNVEFQLFMHQTAKLRSVPLIGAFFTRDAAKLAQTELSGLRTLKNIIALSAEDASTFRSLAPETRILTLPTTFSYPPYERTANRKVAHPIRLGFLGKYSWWPNVEAVDWFINEVLNKVPDKTIELHLFGTGGEQFAGRHSDIKVRGFVPSLSTVWEDSDVIICPMVSGSGINIKFIEAIYNGCPILATTLAARGLPEITDEAVQFLDSSEDWQRFLTSDRLHEMALKRPSAELSSRFSEHTALTKLTEFLDSIGTDDHDKPS